MREPRVKGRAVRWRPSPCYAHLTMVHSAVQRIDNPLWRRYRGGHRLWEIATLFSGTQVQSVVDVPAD
jgi:hypothetical protein